MQAEKRGSKWGGRGANLCSAPKRRKMDEDNGYAETRNVAVKPANDESGEKRKPEDNDVENMECPSAKKRKGFQRDIRLFIKKGVCLNLNNTINASNSRNLIHSETGPPTQDSATEHGVGIGEETQGLATLQCEYNSITVSAPTVQADVTITHKMGLGTAGLEHGVATVSSATTNLLLDTNS